MNWLQECHANHWLFIVSTNTSFFTAVKLSLLNVYRHSEGLSFKQISPLTSLSLRSCDTTAHFTLQAHLEFCFAPKRPCHPSKQFKPNCLNQWIASETLSQCQSGYVQIRIQYGPVSREQKIMGFVRRLWQLTQISLTFLARVEHACRLGWKGHFRLWGVLWWVKAELKIRTQPLSQRNWFKTYFPISVTWPLCRLGRKQQNRLQF